MLTTNGKASGRVLRAFTLIELLVVISIISLLVSILLPSLKRAKQLAVRTVCIVNHRNLVMASTMYAQDHTVYPEVYVSGLNYVKNGSKHAYGFGLLYFGEYTPQGVSGIAGSLYCPSVGTGTSDLPDNNYLPQKVYNQLTPEVAQGSWDPWASNGQARVTYVGHFCLLGGGELRLDGDVLSSSPILTADMGFTNPNPESDPMQGHENEGYCAGFADGSANWIDFDSVYETGAGSHRLSNWGAGSWFNFWRWAAEEYGN